MALVPISEFSFSKDWTKPADFPTFEDDESQVRADLQLQPNEIKSYLNAVLVDYYNNQLLPAINALVAGTVTPDSVYTDSIQAKAITLEKMANDSVGADQLADGSVTADKIANGAVQPGKLGTGAVTNDVIAQDAVRTQHIQAQAITLAKLAAEITAVALGGAAAAHTHAAADVSSGVLDTARIPDLDAAKIISGILAVARIPDLDAAKITSGTFALDRIPGIPPAKLSGVTYSSIGLTTDQVRKITYGTADPSGGSNGDIYLQYS